MRLPRAAMVWAAGLALAAGAFTAPGAAAAPEFVPQPAPVLHPAGALVHGTVQSLRRSGTTTAAALPTSVDLSAWAMPVGDQGLVGSCVPWAINYAQMGWYANRAGRSFVGAPMYVYSQIHADNSSDGGGTWPSAAYRVATEQGVDTRADYVPQGDYDFTDLPTRAQVANAAKHKMVSPAGMVLYNRTAPGPSAITAIKAQLAKGNPVALQLPIYSAFDDLDSTDWTLDSRDIDAGTLRGYHEVLILGYDASGVRIENSWGTFWGQNGFANLDWRFITDYSIGATYMTGLATDPTPPPVPDQVPGVPTSTTANVTGADTASLSWQPPTNAGSSPVTGYRVTRSGTGTQAPTLLDSTLRTQQFTGLTQGSYRLSVAAVNAAGTGPAAAVTVNMTGPAVPKGRVEITKVRYRSPEYVVVRNRRTTILRLKNWILDAGDSGQRFVLPGHRVAADDKVRIYTGGGHKQNSPHRVYLHLAHGIWAAHGDTATLLNRHLHVVSQFSYKSG